MNRIFTLLLLCFLCFSANASAPVQIHVRTWQPEYLDKTRGHKMNPEDIFTLGDFDI